MIGDKLSSSSSTSKLTMKKSTVSCQDMLRQANRDIKTLTYRLSRIVVADRSSLVKDLTVGSGPSAEFDVLPDEPL